MFMPLSMAVAFAMIASFLLSQTLVPVMSNWLIRKMPTASAADNLAGIKKRLGSFIDRSHRSGAWIVPVVIVSFVILAYIAYQNSGTEIFPKVDAGQIQLRLRLPAGTRIERTEEATKKTLSIMDSLAGKGNIAISSSFVGLQPPTYAINPIFLYTSGPQEALIKVNLARGTGIEIENLKEELRAVAVKDIPGVLLSFEPADLVDQVMSQGSDNPIEVVIQGKNLNQSRDIAEKLELSMKKISSLRDIQIAQPLDYPTIQINYDRIKTGQMGLTLNNAGKSVTEGTSSSRLTDPVYWLDNASGNAYQVQVEYPQFMMNSPDQIEQIPVGKVNDKPIYLRDIADWKKGNSIGEYDRLNQQRFITVTANIHKQDLGNVISEVNGAIKQLGELPAGVKVYQRGQSEILSQTIKELSSGLLLAMLVIGLMLTAYFQSFRISLIILSVFPGVIAGSQLLLWITGNTMNIQSFMGCIMALGVAVANTILLVSNAEFLRAGQIIPDRFGASAAANRLRPIVMTSIAMIVGMIPISLGLGESGKQTAPLAIAVIGGLLFSSFISLVFIPIVYDLVIKNKKSDSVSLDPNDKTSSYYDQHL
jgi:multidrug efflux pump subunit AcrB